MINPNDPAFPQPMVVHENLDGIKTTIEYHPPYAGLPIRAELAAKALQGILSNPSFIEMIKEMDLKVGSVEYKSTIAKTAVKYADAIIAELNKTT